MRWQQPSFQVNKREGGKGGGGAGGGKVSCSNLAGIDLSDEVAVAKRLPMEGP